MDRREFLKKAVQIGGVAALYNLGVTLEQAQAWGVLPAVVGGRGGTPGEWANWDEVSQSSLAGSSIYCVFHDAAGVGNDDTGEGHGLSGADLVATDVAGTIDAAAGSPPYRTIDGNTEAFEWTQTWWDTIFKGSATWTIIVKFYSSGDDSYFIAFEAPNCHLYLHLPPNTQGFSLRDSDNALENQTTTNAHPDATIAWYCVWCDGSVCRGGFSTTRPTKWSDFASTDRVEFTALFDNFPTNNNRKYVGGIPGNASWFSAGRMYYTVASSSCLIDNDS